LTIKYSQILLMTVSELYCLSLFQAEDSTFPGR
jgi:hypothetical protein